MQPNPTIKYLFTLCNSLDSFKWYHVMMMHEYEPVSIRIISAFFCERVSNSALKTFHRIELNWLWCVIRNKNADHLKHTYNKKIKIKIVSVAD